MKKLIILISLSLFITLIKSATPSPRVGGNGQVYVSTIPDWTCTITFNSMGVPVYIAGMSATFPYIDNGNTGAPVDSISWSGTSCNCWVSVFEHDNFDDANSGFWTAGNSSYDLTAYNFLEDSDLAQDVYSQWNTAVASYRVYCF